MSIDKALFRQVAGSFASGVTVITTGSEGSFHGMTASAFTSLSIDPTLVLVCVDKNARTLGALHESQMFNVNILAADQEFFSRTFSSKDSPHAHGLVGIDYKLGELGLPILDGVLAFFECRVVHAPNVGHGRGNVSRRVRGTARWRPRSPICCCISKTPSG